LVYLIRETTLHCALGGKFKDYADVLFFASYLMWLFRLKPVAKNSVIVVAIKCMI